MARRAVLLAVAALLWTAGPAWSANTNVNIQGFAFQPATVTISVGDMVTWTQKDAGTQHTVTADDGSFTSQALPVQGTYQHTFSQAGTVKYHCNIHPSMMGSVVVQGAAPPPTQPPAPSPTAAPQPAGPQPTAAPTPRPTVAPAPAVGAPSTTVASTTTAPPAVAESTPTTAATGDGGGDVALPAKRTRTSSGHSGPSAPLVALAVVLAAGAATGSVVLRRRLS